MSNLCHLTSFVLYNLSSKFSADFWLTKLCHMSQSLIGPIWIPLPEILFLMALGSQIFRQSLVVLLKCPSKTSLKSRSCKFWRVVFPALAYLRHNFASYHSIFLIQKKKKKFHSFKAVLGILGIQG